MQTLLTIKEQDIVPNAPQADESTFKTREAARGVVLDQAGEVYLLNVTLHNYHKLPGGGIDEGEDPIAAMKRECLEEVGCHVEIVAELGTIIEHRDQFELVQTSYCYIVKQVGEQVESALEEGELAEGMVEAKAKSIDDAIRILEQNKPNNYEGLFIQKRDLAILKAAKAHS